MLCVVCFSLCVVRWLLVVACCWFLDERCPLFVCCALCVVCCLLLVACCLVCVVCYAFVCVCV